MSVNCGGLFLGFDLFCYVVQNQLVGMYWIMLGNWTINGIGVVLYQVYSNFNFYTFFYTCFKMVDIKI